MQKYRNYLKRPIDEKKLGKKKPKLISDVFQAQWIDQDESYPRVQDDAQQNWIEIGKSNNISNSFSDLPNLFPDCVAINSSVDYFG